MTESLTSLRAAALIASVAAACSDGTREHRESHPDTLPRVAAPPSTAPAETVAAYPFRWSNVGTVTRVLAGRGLRTRNAQPVSQPFMSVRGTVLQVDGAELQVFIYGDVGAVMRDVSRLDTTRVSPPTMMISWRAKPSIVVANNLAAIIVTDDEAVRQRIHGALTAETHGGPEIP